MARDAQVGTLKRVGRAGLVGVVVTIALVVAAQVAISRSNREIRSSAKPSYNAGYTSGYNWAIQERASAGAFVTKSAREAECAKLAHGAQSGGATWVNKDGNGQLASGQIDPSTFKSGCVAGITSFLGPAV